MVPKIAISSFEKGPSQKFDTLKVLDLFAFVYILFKKA